MKYLKVMWNKHSHRTQNNELQFVKVNSNKVINEMH